PERTDVEDLHGAGKRGLRKPAGAAGMPGVRRVSRARVRGAALRGPADLPGDGGQRQGATEEEEAPPPPPSWAQAQASSPPRCEEEDAMTARLATVLSLCALALAASAQTASATEPISSFGVTTSTTAAGAHPSLTTSFTLEEPGEPEAAENVTVYLPQGVFGNPNAIPTCTVSDFALSQCPAASQAGTVVVRANYNGNPNALLGAAPVYDLAVQVEGETARLAFVVPTLDIPVSVPIQVRTGSDYGLRMTVAGITQSMPLAGATMSVWGFPAALENDDERFLPGSPGNPAGCPGVAGARGAPNTGQAPHHANVVEAPMIDNPSPCTGEPLTVSLDVRTYQDPTQVSHAEDQYPPTTACDEQTFEPALNAG